MTIKELVLWIWQLPQNLLGLLLLSFYKHECLYHTVDGRRFYYTDEMISGISLGNFIIMNRADFKDGMRHEFGHSVDSRRLGPLYLLIIGIPSALGNLVDRCFHKKWSYKESYTWYYSLPWERSADVNGGVDRQKLINELS